MEDVVGVAVVLRPSTHSAHVPPAPHVSRVRCLRRSARGHCDRAPLPRRPFAMPNALRTWSSSARGSADAPRRSRPVGPGCVSSARKPPTGSADRSPPRPSPPDEHPWIESFGCTRSYREFRDGVRAYYLRHYPLTTAARNTARLNPGNGSVSRLCHEPRVALAVLHELLAPFISARQLRVCSSSTCPSPLTSRAIARGPSRSGISARDERRSWPARISSTRLSLAIAPARRVNRSMARHWQRQRRLPPSRRRPTGSPPAPSSRRSSSR